MTVSGPAGTDTSGQRQISNRGSNLGVGGLTTVAQLSKHNLAQVEFSTGQPVTT